MGEETSVEDACLHHCLGVELLRTCLRWQDLSEDVYTRYVRSITEAK